MIYNPVNLLKKKSEPIEKIVVTPHKATFQLYAHPIYYRYFKNWKQILYTGYPTFPPKYVLGTYFDQSTMVDTVEIQRWIRHVPSFEKLTV